MEWSPRFEIPPPRHLMALGGAVLTLGAVWAFGSTPEASAPTQDDVTPLVRDAGPSDDPSVEVRALRAALDREVEARRRIEGELGELRELVADLRDERGEGAQKAERPPEETERKKLPGLFDPDELVAAGIDPRDADGLRALWEAVEMEKIRLTNVARRQGWADTPRHRQELEELDLALREDLGTPGYDRYLYATGRDNRTQVVDVMARSPGAQAGFSVGDLILSYDGEPVFSVAELSELSSSGREGGTARVEVMRDGSSATLYVPRGPLGLMVMPHRAPPR